MTSEELSYLIRINDRDVKEAKRNLDSLNKAADKDLGVASTNADGHLKKMGTAAKVAGVATGVILVKGIKDSVAAAIDAQRVQKATEVQLKSLGISYGAHAKQINQVINSTSQLAALDDEDLQQSFTRLLPATHNVNAALKDMQLAADISRARNISLESATNLVTKANTGSAGALRRLGISLVATNDATAKARRELADYKKTHDSLSPAMDKHFRDEIAAAQATDKHTQATKNLDVLQKTFSGSAKAYGDSAAGAQERYKVALENVQEAIGMGLLPVLSLLLNEGTKILGWVQNHTKVVAIAIGVIGTLVVTTYAVNAATKAWTAAQTVAKAATALWTGAQWLLNAAMSANPIGLVVIAIAALVAAFIIAWKHSETFRRIVTDTWSAIKGGAQDVANFVTVKIPNAFGDVVAWVRRNWPIIATLISGPFAPLVALATNAFGVRSAIEGALGSVKSAASGLIGDIVDFFTGLPKKLAKPIGNVVASMIPFKGGLDDVRGVVDKIVDAFRWLVDHAKDVAGFFGSVGSKLGGAVGKLNPFGDGVAAIKDGAVVLPPGLGIGNGPTSINPGLYDDIAFGQRFGLSVSSGYRPGSITSTGNQSLHSVFPSKAVDLAGSEAAMRAFFQSEIGRPGIAELIHSPYWWHPGAGVQYIPASAGTVLKDHYSHVHVGIFDQGGYLPPGLSLALNMTGRHEKVIAPHAGGGDAPLVHIEHAHFRDELDAQMVGSAVNRALAFRR